MTDEFTARRSYKFGGELTDKSLMLETFPSEKAGGFVSVLSNLPVETCRNGGWTQDIMAAEQTFEKAMQAHDAILKGASK